MMINRNRVAVLIMTILSVAVILGSNPCWAAPAMGSLAPENPKFLEYIEKRHEPVLSANEKASGESGGTEYKLGYIPSPLDLSHVFQKNRSMSDLKSAASYPASYDLRDDERITDVKDQDPFGTCWAFATFASIESYLKPEKSSSFSEYHLAYSAYSGPDSFTTYVDSGDSILNIGGNYTQATALLSRWDGPFFESDCPYDTEGYPPEMESGARIRGHLQNVFILTSPEQIKDAVMNRGAVGTSFCVDVRRFTSDNTSYYYPPDNPVSHGWHAVAIAGWDDDYAKENFAIDGLADSTPEGNGAWLIKNSWGTGWGDVGYFWISYCDSSISSFFSFEIEPADNFRNIYQYDPMGWVHNYSTTLLGDETAWFANVFSSRQTELLKAVSFYAVGAENIYEIYVYDDISGNLIYGPQEGFFENPGYHTVLLDKPVLFEKGEKLIVAVKLTTPEYGFPIPVEFAKKDYSENATAQLGQSFVSGNGNDWIDTTYLDPTMNVCLKAFTGPLVQNISGLVDSIYTDLTGTASADIAFENAREVINGTGPGSAGISGTGLNILELMDYRIISGTLEAGESGIELKNSLVASRTSAGGAKQVIFMAWNYETGQFDVLSAEDEADLSSSATDSSVIRIKDGGVYDSSRIEDGSLSNVKVMEVLAESSHNSTSSGGGCSLGLTVPGSLLMLVPLLLLKIK